ncbi:cyclic AMP response element-binding protein A [Phlebotomus argentipes]|uniref:cyclic AMP response element-binding protein A n=1 Tax=Phlebotomus argentipes TaxID=94469 RepID=UPI0028933669|nr:cyclic AMP response element-binding protein A [Phlebotomus argentipes]
MNMETFYDIGSGDLRELWESDLDPAMQDALKLSSGDPELSDWYLDKDIKMPQVILHDKLMTDALGTFPIKTEHSYSLNSDGDSLPDSPGSLHNKMDDMDDECYPAITMNTAALSTRTTHYRSANPQFISSIQNNCSNDSESGASSLSDDLDIDDHAIKDEPMSPASSSNPPSPGESVATTINASLSNMAAITNTDLVFEHKNGSLQLSHASQSLLKSHQIAASHQPVNQRLVMPKLNVKMEAQAQFGLPPTPPSSLSSDDSEGNLSPDHHGAPMSPQNAPALQATTRRSAVAATVANSSKIYSGVSTRQPIHTPLISSQPKGSTGTLILTEEEKRTLLAEGYPIPTRLPLTKAEEKSLKKIRRKIKNKISAQESRRKKKEYMDQLERKVEILVSENSDYRKRVETLEGSNANLLNQLAKLQALINRQNQKK